MERETEFVTSGEIKKIALGLGADICGVASTERFEGAPKGHHPNDIYPDCRSVVVFAKKVPTESLHATSCVPYTFISGIITQEVDRLTVALAMTLEELGISVVPLPSDDPYEHWESERKYGRAIISMRHAGYLAGLGVLGKNTLLINEKYGNMIQIGAVLVNVDIEPDDLAKYEGCLSSCERCIKACPTKALDGNTVNQKLCRPLSNFVNEKGYVLKKCSICRTVCPHWKGMR